MDFFKKHKTIEDLLPEFIMTKEVKDSLKVWQSYEHHIKVLLHWMESQGIKNTPIDKITSENIRDFFFWMGKNDYDKTTCERYFLSTRAIFKYAQENGHLHKVPFDKVVFPRKKKDSGAAMIQNIHLKPVLEEMRDKDPQLYLAAMTQYYCFIRPGRELRLLKVGDVDLEKGLITIRQENAKNKKKQIVTMPQQLIDIYIQQGIPQADQNHFIFGKKKKPGPVPSSINMHRWRFNKIRERLHLPKEYKWYSFKHTGASNLHMSGISMRELMDQLRHTQLEATSHYLKRHCGIVNERIRNNFPSPI
jgi:site-specific recombinase XerD